ncbi:BZ3500_MvSof-1268-A1-R1_Chr10-2g03009 [Microbotryum saponariae]|uniref:BZ3500_MvSof-1268-A1-R1_Chr10-2g03009 protein n=1 Tax=Microbotryum saponariae TaxID=289078 RepID=A0A2X0KD34_9BASI|nr:BZ3501_MvSof-1269-A2-R1_Chr10-2g02595 [Microbotryum saponariae]SDA01920.1 BZ3500_MvSof-1268-A1-R1_Chr10-2g03009 [Microbotryum saponariae]
MPPRPSDTPERPRPALQALEPFLRLLAISHREIESVVADALGRCLGLLTRAQWKELGLNPSRWRALFMSILFYLLREDGGAGTGGNASVGSDAYEEERALFRRVSGGKDVICFSYAWTSVIRATIDTKMHRVFVPKLVYPADWWGDRVMMLIVGLFGWKDRVPAVLRVFASAGFVTPSAGGRHQVYELKVAEANFRNQSLKRIVEAMLLVPLLRDRATHPATADPKLEAALRALYKKAHKIIPDAATFDPIYTSARQVIFDAIQVVEEHLDKMVGPIERDQLRRQHTLGDLVQGKFKFLPTQVLLPALHALKIKSGRSLGIGPDFAPEFITMSLRRTAIILWKGSEVARVLVKWLDGVWIPWAAQRADAQTTNEEFAGAGQRVREMLRRQVDSQGVLLGGGGGGEEWVIRPEWEAQWYTFCEATIHGIFSVTTPPRSEAPGSDSDGDDADLGPPTQVRKVTAAQSDRGLFKPNSDGVPRYLTGKGPLVVLQLFNFELFGPHRVPHGQWQTNGHSVQILTLDVAEAVLEARSSPDSEAAIVPRQTVYETFDLVTDHYPTWYSSKNAGPIFRKLIQSLRKIPSVTKSATNPKGVGHEEQSVRWVTKRAVKQPPTLPGGMPMIQRVENGREEALQAIFQKATGESWGDYELPPISTCIPGCNELASELEAGVNRDVVSVGIDPGTKCPVAISSRLYDRNGTPMEDELVLYASSVEQALRSTQERTRVIDAELGAERRFGLQISSGPDTAGMPRIVPATATPGPAPRVPAPIAPTDALAVAATDAHRSHAGISDDAPSTEWLRSEPERQAAVHNSRVHAKATVQRLVDQVMSATGVRVVERALNGTRQQQALDSLRSPELALRDDILSSEPRLFIFFIGAGGSSRGTVHATYRTNVFLRALVAEIERLKRVGLDILVYYVDEDLTSSLCSNQDCRNEHGHRSRSVSEFGQGRVEVMFAGLITNVVLLRRPTLYRLNDEGTVEGSAKPLFRVLQCERGCQPPVHRDLVAAKNIRFAGLHCLFCDHHPFKQYH